MIIILHFPLYIFPIMKQKGLQYNKEARNFTAHFDKDSDKVDIWKRFFDEEKGIDD